MLSLLLFVGIIIPILSTVDWQEKFSRNNERHFPEEEVIVDGEPLSPESPFYWELYDMQYRTKEMEQEGMEPLEKELWNAQMEVFTLLAKNIKSHEDYRRDVGYKYTELSAKQFVLNHLDISAEEMMMLVQNLKMGYFDPNEMKDEYYSLSEEEVRQKIIENDEELAKLTKVIKNNDSSVYLNYIIDAADKDIKKQEAEIARLEQEIIDQPDNEELFSAQIEGLKNQIQYNKEIQIPINQYRLENGVVPQSDTWQERALQGKESAMQSLQYTTIMTQQEYNEVAEENEYFKEQYGSYQNYKEEMQEQINFHTELLLKADQSLATQKPDISFVNKGARVYTRNFLLFSLIFVFFACVLAGTVIAKEFQQGTIRLLLIRPKHRSTIALAKMLSIFIVVTISYLATVIVNIITNGIVFGFGDYVNPIYTISSKNGLNFLFYLAPKILGCVAVIFFATTLGYGLSVITRNVPASISIALVSILGSIIVSAWIGSNPDYGWIMKTPLPYINMPILFAEVRGIHLSEVYAMAMGHGYASYSGYYPSYYSGTATPDFVYGTILLLALSTVFTVIGTYVFCKKDIAN